MVDFEGPAAQPAGFVDAPVCGPAGRTRRLRSRPVKPPQAGRSLRHRHLRRQAADLRTTSQPRPRRQNDSIGALGGRTPSLTTTQGSRSGWLAVILERRLHSCDELHVARRDAQAAAPAQSKKRRHRMASCATDVFARLPHLMERVGPLRGRTGAVSPPGRQRAQHLQRQPPRLRGSVDFGAAPLAAERAGRRRRGRGGAPGLRAALGRPREAERPRLGRSCAPRAPATAPRRRPQS